MDLRLHVEGVEKCVKMAQPVPSWPGPSRPGPDRSGPARPGPAESGWV